MAPKWLGKVVSALGKGAEVATGLGIFYGWASSKLSGMMVERFGLADPEEQQQLRDFAQTGVDAGLSIDQLPGDEPIDLAIVPVNPYLFGDTPGGRRGKHVGEFQIFPGGKWYRLDTDVADFLTKDDLEQAMLERALEWLDASPTAFGLAPDALVDVNAVRTNFVERKW